MPSLTIIGSIGRAGQIDWPTITCRQPAMRALRVDRRLTACTIHRPIQAGALSFSRVDCTRTARGR